MDDQDLRADVVVVGLGLIGSGALRHLATDGVDVVGVGPAEPEDWAQHTGVFASHYDSGRITRKLDARFEWAELAVRAIAQYPTIAADGGIDFHVPAGIVFASTDPAHIAELEAVGRRVGADFQELRGLATTEDGRVLVADGLLAVPAGSAVIAEPGPAGHVDPRRMLRAQLAAAEAHGARLLREQVTAVEPDGGGWRITTVDGTVLRAARVLLATGAHTDELGPARAAFPGVVRPETVVLATLDATEQERLAAMPAVFSHLTGTSFRDLYQVPPAPYPDGTVKLKLGATLRKRSPLATAEARRAWMSGDAHEALLAELRGLVEVLVPELRAESWATKPCMITDTPSGVPTVDHLAPGLVVAAGGNGYAAKSADAIGALAAGLLVAGTWTDPVLPPEPFARSG
ncbi:FAD-binding oxidoreductase [soil metagenome]